MSHKDVLEQLIPVDLGGIHDEILTVEGAALDRAGDDMETLRESIVTDIETLQPPADDRMKMAPVRWDIKAPFYVKLAAVLGYTITIEDIIESQSDWSGAGDPVQSEPWVLFSAGVSGAGQTLGYQDYILNWLWLVTVIGSPVTPAADLETLLNDLKPAHIQLIFTYV